MGRKPVTRPPNPLDDGPMLKMKELVEATRVNRATILYYVSKRLLPKPVKTSPNIAFYSSSMVERIQLIRQLQSTHRFSLDQIRTILREKDQGRDIQTLIDFNKEVFSQEEGKTLDLKSFCKSSGLNEKQVQKALELKLLLPNSDDAFDSSDLACGHRLKHHLDTGFPLKDLSFYAVLADQIIEKEIDLRNRIILEKSYDESLNLTLNATQGARFFREYIIERKFQKKASQQPLIIDK